MQIVIKLSDKIYDTIMYDEMPTNEQMKAIVQRIYEGTPLPKGHGRIGDLDQILMWMIYKKGIIDKLKCGEITPVFKDATIIEAESEETIG